jgi:hypothetical protein
MLQAEAVRVGRAIELHMATNVTLADGAESVLLDRATAIDVRGAEFDRIAGVRDDVIHDFPRGPFDRPFIAAIRREVEVRPGCQSERLLGMADRTDWKTPTPWATVNSPVPRR